MNVREVSIRYKSSQIFVTDNRLTTSADVYMAFRDFSLEAVEQFICLYLDGKNRILCYEVVSRGTLTRSLVHPREVFWTAIHLKAVGIICIHNHPSGDFTPSHEDRAITKRLVETGKVIGIKVLDHIIITERGYYSFADQGEL